MSLAEFGPLLAAALLGGALADARDRARMVLLAEVGLAGCSAALLANALLPRPQLAVLYVLAALMAVLDGFQRPSLDALLPRIVSRGELPAAAVLSALRETLDSSPARRSAAY